ncbi:MAG: hypothetical protein ACK4PC_03505 [Sphingopyxis sp.]
MSGAASPAAYAVAPMAAVIDPAVLEAWFARAEDGERMLIARGRTEPKSALAWIVVDAWRIARLVVVHAEADPESAGVMLWIAERRRPSGDEAGQAAVRRAGRARAPEAPDGTPVSNNILRAIKRAANLGMAAPSLAQLASGAGLRSASHAKYYVDKLKLAGRIGVESRQIKGGSRVRYAILSTRGAIEKWTGWGV